VSGSIYELTGPDFAAAISSSSPIVIPFGSIEQHGPHLPCGTDTMAAEAIARELVRLVDGVLVPFGPYGITPIHQGHAGTVSLRRSTFDALLEDVCSELARMGARRFIFVNWHEGNTASLNAVATDLQARLAARFYVAQACYVAQRIYAERGGELTHGGGIETLAVKAHDPNLVHLDRAGSGSRPRDAAATDAMRRSREVYGFVTDVTELAADGWYGDPAWAESQDADKFATEVAAEIAAQLAAVDVGDGERE
jgi:creatinine amidohydrolase